MEVDARVALIGGERKLGKAHPGGNING